MAELQEEIITNNQKVEQLQQEKEQLIKTNKQNVEQLKQENNQKVEQLQQEREQLMITNNQKLEQLQQDKEQLINLTIKQHQQVEQLQQEKEQLIITNHQNVEQLQQKHSQKVEQLQQEKEQLKITNNQNVETLQREHNKKVERLHQENNQKVEQLQQKIQQLLQLQGENQQLLITSNKQVEQLQEEKQELIKALNKALEIKPCLKHQLPVYIFCDEPDCQEIVCETCVFQKHVNHKTMTIADKITKVKEEIKPYKEVLDSGKAEFGEQITTMKDLKTEIQNTKINEIIKFVTENDLHQIMSNKVNMEKVYGKTMEQVQPNATQAISWEPDGCLVTLSSTGMVYTGESGGTKIQAFDLNQSGGQKMVNFVPGSINGMVCYNSPDGRDVLVLGAGKDIFLVEGCTGIILHTLHVPGFKTHHSGICHDQDSANSVLVAGKMGERYMLLQCIIQGGKITLGNNHRTLPL